MQNIKNKVVAITGASSGIGKAIAITLTKLGAKVVLGARREHQLQEVVSEIKHAHGEAFYLRADVTQQRDLQNLAELAVEKFGKLDVIVNNAGVAAISRIDELDIKGWNNMIDINLKGTLNGMAAALPIFKKQHSGHIVNIISTSGIKITPLQGVYAATKNAVRTLSEAFRQESDGKIRITSISPGMTKTSFVDDIDNEELKSAVSKIAISPEAIANAVVYAISQPNDVEVGSIVIRPAVQN
ncbi:SDR family oxidoreductase [Fulvivirga ligni]|uniref:SDR family oxidoreductase n=1 Tax=Fulvivirga ligni TaxID=2904246 RepID=UPI001F17AF55|nr:SDR family oxidoreductase [Fulvivirga ligni]UII20751.1 SDR family oxidoreductase [Fulvivirga ligni]